MIRNKFKRRKDTDKQVMSKLLSNNRSRMKGDFHVLFSGLFFKSKI